MKALKISLLLAVLLSGTLLTGCMMPRCAAGGGCCCKQMMEQMQKGAQQKASPDASQGETPLRNGDKAK